MEQQAYIGKDSIKEIIPLLKKYNTKHVFLVRGKDSFAACGAKYIINNALSEMRCTLTEFYDFSENPKYEDIKIGIELLKNSGADMIIAVGGGSVLDISKLIRFFNSYNGEIIGKSFEKVGNLLPLIAIPTTAGTGAEATHFAVVYKDKVKYSAEHHDILPDYAIIYPPFTYGNPKYLTACTGFDALAQAIEAFWNLNATWESDKYAEKAIKLLWHNLSDVVNNPTEELRDKVSEGSYWAGRAINITKTTAPHAFSYPFTTYYGYPHGHAVALTFPYFAELNFKIIDKNKVAVFEKLISQKTKNIRNIFIEYISKLGLEFNIDKPIETNIILSNININRLNNNPFKINKNDAETILSTILKF